MSDDPVSAGLKSAADTTKQIITLASGIVAVTITFAKEFKASGSNVLQVPYELKIAWILYGLSVMLGVFTLLAITGSLGEPKHPNAQKGVMGSNVRLPSYAMLACFLAGFALTIAAGFKIVH